MADGSFPLPELDIAPGWTGADRARLDRVADVAMSLAEAAAGRSVDSALPAANVIRAAASFTQAARCVRLTLAMRAGMSVLPQEDPDNPDSDAVPLALLGFTPGWFAPDLARLERLADLAVDIAEAMGKRASDPDHADRAVSAYAQVARCLRLSLSLKAKVAAGDPAFPWRGAVAHPEELWFEPDPDDPDALTHDGLMKRAAAEVRMAFEHAILDYNGHEDWTLDDADKAQERQHRRRETLERAIEREREHESFRLGPDLGMLERLCDELDLPCDLLPLYDSDGDVCAMVVKRPSDPRFGVIRWAGQGPFHIRFLEPWVRPKPTDPP